jgi:Myb-like DNA-binding domain
LENILESGKKWSQISKHLEGRTENAVKNRFITMVRQYLKTTIPKRSRDKGFNPLNVSDSIIKQIIASLSKQTIKKYEENPVKHRKISNEIIIPIKNNINEKNELQVKQEINEELEKTAFHSQKPKLPMKRNISMETIMDTFRLKSIPRIGSFESATDTSKNEFKKFNTNSQPQINPSINNRKGYNFDSYNYFDNPDFPSLISDERFYEQGGFVELFKIISNAPINYQMFGCERGHLKSGEGDEMTQPGSGVNLSLGSPKRNIVIHKNESCSNFLNLE